ncbi:hypothetical protein Zmor_025875 [Zophobas morio]|uniref:Uncharacterized protein n=1 Tax=Zophobas morio TaxID=2755281 RepID=A0AA38M5H4_9CUCU|nr:hypothetical protein Zmor_025875 [Zophobas morio]
MPIIIAPDQMLVRAVAAGLKQKRFGITLLISGTNPRTELSKRSASTLSRALSSAAPISTPPSSPPLERTPPEVTSLCRWNSTISTLRAALSRSPSGDHQGCTVLRSPAPLRYYYQGCTVLRSPALLRDLHQGCTVLRSPAPLRDLHQGCTVLRSPCAASTTSSPGSHCLGPLCRIADVVISRVALSRSPVPHRRRRHLQGRTVQVPCATYIAAVIPYDALSPRSRHHPRRELPPLR